MVNTIVDYQYQITNLLNTFPADKGGSDPSEHYSPATENDDAIIEQASQAKNGEKLSKLHSGDWQGLYPSQSEADLAFVNIIAYYTSDPEQVARIFFYSALGQAPKDNYPHRGANKAYVANIVKKSFDQKQTVRDFSNVTSNGQALRIGPPTVSSASTADDKVPWIKASALQSKKFPAKSWIIPVIMPPGAIILAGRPKLGKSWWALDAAIAVAEGGFTLGRHCEPGDVLYAALEDTQRRLQDRMAKLRGSSPWPDSLSFVTELPRSDQGGIDAVRLWITSANNPKLVIIDTLAKTRPGKKRKEDNYEADYAAVSAWKSLADEFEIAVVLVHHVRKQQADDPLEMISGTNGLTGAADSLMILDRNGQGCSLSGRGRDVEEFSLAIQFDAETCRWDMLGNKEDVQRSIERKAILAVLENAEASMSPKDIADALGRDSNPIHQLLPKMVAAGEIVKSARGSYSVTPSKNDKNKSVPLI